MNRHASAPSGLSVDANTTTVAAVATPMMAGVDGADSSGLCAMPYGRGAAVGTGCAAAKASRESRTNSTYAAPNASQHDIAAKQAEKRLRDAHTADENSKHGDGRHCAESSLCTAAHWEEKGQLMESGKETVPTTEVRGGLAENHIKNSVHLLQRMQQLLREGVSADTLQQWVATQLQCVLSSGDVKESREPFFVPALAMESSPSHASTIAVAADDTRATAPTTPTSDPCRPTSDVSSSLLSGYPTTTQQVSSTKANAFHTIAAAVVSPATSELPISNEEVAILLTPPSQQPETHASLVETVPRVATHTPPSPTRIGSNSHTTPLKANVPDPNSADSTQRNTKSSSTTVNSNLMVLSSPTHGIDTSQRTAVPSGLHGTGHEEVKLLVLHTPSLSRRRGSRSVGSSPANTTSLPAIAANGGGLRRAPRTHSLGQHTPQQQQQWRSHSRSGSITEMPARNLTNFSPTSAAAARRAQESNLHEVTKAAFHATTSQLVADEQRNIGLLLGERFSRNPELMVRRLATPPAPVTSTLAVTTVSDGRQKSSCGAGDSCLASTLCERAEVPTTSPQTHSPTIACSMVAVPLGIGTNFQSSDAPGPLPYSSQFYSAEVSTDGRRRRSLDQRNDESFVNGAPTAAPAVSGRSTPVEMSSTSTLRVATPQSMTLPAATIGNSRDSEISLLSTSASLRRQHTNPRLSGNAQTLPTSAWGMTETLSSEQDSLFTQRSPFVSPTLPRALMKATGGGDKPQEVSSGGSHDLSPTVMATAAALSTSDTPLPTAANDDLLSPMAAAANANPLIDMVAGEDSGSGTMTVDLGSTSASKGNTVSVPVAAAVAAYGEMDEKGGKAVPRVWGVTAATGDRAAAAAASGMTNAAARLPPVNSSPTHHNEPRSPSSVTNGNALGFSPLTTSGAAAMGFLSTHNHRTTQPYGNVTSFVSNTSSHLGGNAAATASLGNYPEGRSILSLVDDVQSFDSSRVSCMSGGRDGALTGTGPNRLRRSSVLHLSHTSVNGGIDPLMDGVMPDFILDSASAAHNRPGPRFMRTYCRHSPARVPESVTQQALEALGVPYLSDIDEAANPMNVLHLMDTYKYTDTHAFYVVMSLNVLLRYNLVRRFAWDAAKLKRFLEVAATFFRDGNPFHHPIHATDMVLGAHQWLSEGTTAAALSDDEIAAFLLAAITLQLSHTGADNRLLTQIKHPYAMLCSFTSPQQGAIVALVMALLRHPELHFFPDPNSATLNVQTEPLDCAKDTAPANLAHEWTARRELQLFEMLSELVMATDLRNHSMIQQSILRMAEENAQRHGCLCAGTSLFKPLSACRTSKNNRARGGAALNVTPNRPQREEVNGSMSSRFNTSSSVPLQPEDTTSPKSPNNKAFPSGRICLRCCAYVTEYHVPDLLKGVLHYLGFPFLYRTYENYISGTLMFVAEMFRQSEVEYKIFQQQQQQQQQSSNSINLEPQPDPSNVHTVPQSTFSHSRPQQGGELGDPTETFAAAVTEEKQPWRQDFTHASTVASLQRRRSGEADSASLFRRTTTNLADHVNLTVAAAAGVPLYEGSAGQHPRTVSDDMASTVTALPPKTPRVRPLLGLGRDILLIGVEDLSLPFVEFFAPYLPESWVRATYLNHQTFTVAMPSPEEYDEAVIRVLNLAEESEEEIVERQTREEGDANDLMTAVPWLLMRRTCPSNPDWTVNRDGVMQRVVEEIVTSTQSIMEQCEI